VEGLELRGRVNHHATTGICAGFFAPLYGRGLRRKGSEADTEGFTGTRTFLNIKETGLSVLERQRKRDREGKSSSRAARRPFLVDKYLVVNRTRESQSTLSRSSKLAS
jgi:hypothetical protein